MNAIALALCLLAASARASDYAPLYRDARSILKALVALDTTNPPGNEIIAARYLKTQLDPEGIDSDVFVSMGTRASLIARLKGLGQERPLLLMCHTDVVPADKSGWKTDPFVPVERGGYLYGRGTVDVKSMCASEAAVLLWLRRRRVPLSRDVLFFAEADEESAGDDRHIDWLLRAHPDALAAEFGINEGGEMRLEKGKVREIRLQAAEKEYLDVTVSARGTAGHASIPKADNPVARVARAAARLSEFHPPAELNDVVRSFLETKSREEDSAELRAAIKDVLNAPQGAGLDAAADRLAALSPELGAMLRDTLVPTVLRAGSKSNVIPAQAEAVFNARLLPGHKKEDFEEALRSLVKAERVELSFEGSGPSAAASFLDTDLYRAIESAAADVAPRATFVPYMSAWSTDSQSLRSRGVSMYGLWPPLTEEDEKGIHGVDERLNLKGFDDYTRLLLEAVLKTASLEGRAMPKLPADALQLPLVHQATDYSCGPAALLSVLKYWKGYDRDETSLYLALGTTAKDGTEAPKLAEGAKYFGLASTWKENAELSELRAALKRGQTVILDLQAWRDQTTRALRWAADWEDGHFVALIGMDEHFAYFMDPWVQGRYAFLPLSELAERWHDEDPRQPGWRYQRLAIFIDGPASPARAADFAAALTRME